MNARKARELRKKAFEGTSTKRERETRSYERLNNIVRLIAVTNAEGKEELQEARYPGTIKCSSAARIIYKALKAGKGL